MIEKVTQPFDWYSPMVPMMNAKGKLRICVDVKRVNEQIKRERYMLPTTEEVLAKLTGAKVFSSPDASSGFWQTPLHSESSVLMTFISAGTVLSTCHLASA